MPELSAQLKDTARLPAVTGSERVANANHEAAHLVEQVISFENSFMLFASRASDVDARTFDTAKRSKSVHLRPAGTFADPRLLVFLAPLLVLRMHCQLRDTASRASYLAAIIFGFNTLGSLVFTH